MLKSYQCKECGTDLPAATPAERKILCADCFNRRWESLLTAAVAQGTPIPPTARAKA